jgi:hypothetical protein
MDDTNRFGVFPATVYANEVCRSGVQIPTEQESFLSSKTSRPTRGPSQPLIQWVPGVKRSGHEIGHTPPSSAEVKNGHAVAQLVEALLYKPEGRGFDSRCHWNFSLT